MGNGTWMAIAWLTTVGLTLVASGHYFDGNVPDFARTVGAWALGYLSRPTQSKAKRTRQPEGRFIA